MCKEPENTEEKDGNSNTISLPEKKVEYLQMIQEPIGRMSTISSVIKGFSATIVAGVTSFSGSIISKWALILAILPVLVFGGLDVYYLRLERKFRWLYEQVRCGKHLVDFSMKPEVAEEDIKEAKTSFWSCLFSQSIWPFYLVLMIVFAIVIFLKYLQKI